MRTPKVAYISKKTNMPQSNFFIFISTLLLGKNRSARTLFQFFQPEVLRNNLQSFCPLNFNVRTKANYKNLKMGCSLAFASSLRHCYLNRSPPAEGLRNAMYVNRNQRLTVNFKIPEFYRRTQSRMSFCCKLEGIDFEERTSPAEVKKEIEQCYELIHRLGRGVVYLGSSRLGPNHPHYAQAFELGKEIANLLNCTSWSGAGPGLMDAVTKGALQAGKPVGGFKISKEAGEWTATKFHPYLPLDSYLTCRFFSARKHGLVDAAVRATSSDKTAVVALPGGIGTMDEAFEILALIQLERVGSVLPVPFVLMNYDSFYSKLLNFIDDCEGWGTVSRGEVASLWKVCNTNSEALAYLAEYYALSATDEDRVSWLKNDYKPLSS